MASEVAELQERLKAQLTQIGRECVLFERIMYRGKNAHRRSLYYRDLSKVRRDLRLFRSAHLKDILKKHYQVIEGNKRTRKKILFEGLKTRNSIVEGYEFQSKLLGVARLLAQMIEPIIDASLHLSGLLGLFFYMGFSLTMLALLARLRVLLQQTLYDVVRVFNMSSSVSQKKQSLIFLEGVAEGVPKVFTDYHPSNRQTIVLELHWDGVKFCLQEKFSQSERAIADIEGALLLDDDQANDLQSLPKASSIKYNSYGTSPEGMANAESSISATMKNSKETTENIPTVQIRKPDCGVTKNNDHGELLLPYKECSKDLLVGNVSSERSILSDSTIPQSSEPAESKSKKKRKVDLISVDVPSKTEAKLNDSGMANAESSISATMKNRKDTTENIPTVQTRKPGCVVTKNNDHDELLLPNKECSKDLLVGNVSSVRSRLSDSTLPQSSKPAESKSRKKRKVDFISVDVPLKTEAKLNSSGMANAGSSISATMKNRKDTTENIPTVGIRKPDCVVTKNNDHGELLLPNKECSKDLLVGNVSSERSRLSDSTLPQSSNPAESKSKKKRKVDFISVDVPLKTQAKLNNSGKKLKPASNNGLSERVPSSANETTDHFFSLLVGENRTKSLF